MSEAVFQWRLRCVIKSQCRIWQLRIQTMLDVPSNTICTKCIEWRWPNSAISVPIDRRVRFVVRRRGSDVPGILLVLVKSTGTDSCDRFHQRTCVASVKGLRVSWQCANIQPCPRFFFFFSFFFTTYADWERINCCLIVSWLRQLLTREDRRFFFLSLSFFVNSWNDR